MVKNEIGFIPKYIRFPGGASNTISRKYCPGIMSILANEVIDRGYQFYDWNYSTGDAGGNNIPVIKSLLLLQLEMPIIKRFLLMIQMPKIPR